MKLYQKVKGFAWIFLLSLSGTLIRFTSADENLLVITINGTSEKREKCVGLRETFESTSSLEISSSHITSPCSCTLSSVQRYSVPNVTKPITEVLVTQNTEDIAFQASLPCIAESDWEPVSRLQFLLIPSGKHMTRVYLMSGTPNSCRLPLSVTNKDQQLYMECQLSAANASLGLDNNNNQSKPHLNISITVWKNRDTENGTAGEESKPVNSPSLLHSRPAHNNVIVVAVICVLVGVIVLSGSLILISLVMHRKRLARRLAIHLRNLEEQGHPEAVPLTDTPDRQTDQHVKLVGIRRLDSSEANGQLLTENCFQPVSPGDICSLPLEYDPTEESYLTEGLNGSGGASSINNELFKSCDKTSLDVRTSDTAVVSKNDYDSDSGASDSFQDSIADTLEESLTGSHNNNEATNDSGSNTEDKSVQTLNTGGYYQFFPSLMRMKFPKLRWRSKSFDSEHT